MKNNSEMDLLVDIAKLLKKYDLETFEILSKRISSKEFSKMLSNLLTTTVKVSCSAQKQPIPKEKKATKVKAFDEPSELEQWSEIIQNRKR